MKRIMLNQQTFNLFVALITLSMPHRLLSMDRKDVSTKRRSMSNSDVQEPLPRSTEKTRLSTAGKSSSDPLVASPGGSPTGAKRIVRTPSIQKKLRKFILGRDLKEGVSLSEPSETRSVEEVGSPQELLLTEEELDRRVEKAAEQLRNEMEEKIAEHTNLFNRCFEERNVTVARYVDGELQKLESLIEKIITTIERLNLRVQGVEAEIPYDPTCTFGQESQLYLNAWALVLKEIDASKDPLIQAYKERLGKLQQFDILDARTSRAQAILSAAQKELISASEEQEATRLKRIVPHATERKDATPYNSGLERLNELLHELEVSKKEPVPEQYEDYY